ncbi:hypothetical protein C0989_003994 [Termitomyces sp. Mn162]|nr:hypothetical protein C0989_003994 [Termitomyces sp. Mn162]
MAAKIKAAKEDHWQEWLELSDSKQIYLAKNSEVTDSIAPVPLDVAIVTNVKAETSGLINMTNIIFKH